MKRKTKGITIDAMVKFIFSQYEIPTKKDVALILKRLEKIEALLQEKQSVQRRRAIGSSFHSATDQVLNTLSVTPEGLRVIDLQEKTGLSEKTVRNIIFRLHKLGKIRRSQRGIYITVK